MADSTRRVLAHSAQNGPKVSLFTGSGALITVAVSRAPESDCE